ncbi:SDR family oxidoreductase [Streptomyces sp. UNOC14_S4]|uniref:SDR family oxidoreductase n=1 Tax=Streptomyces sp. UNOC14_S4 TaxID=2872340 RepID=UPI001E641081|nr:SDR family oxidoreductase [Streptomyces sp. UNOC14_S4]MCC3772285.1 SDR family oxidoreductase [Streptomyces sp. UNOC14_S4]
MGTLHGRTALVTGGSRGIGRAISERLAREGATVAVHYGRDDEAARRTVKEIEAAGGRAFAIRAELGTEGDAEALWRAFDEHAEGVDILVNNAASGGPRGPVGEVTPADFDRVFAVNAKAPFFVTLLGLERMRDGGRIVNVSTGLTHGARMPEITPYTMTKAAIDAFTANLAKAVGGRGITVNAVAPGVVDTDMNAAWLRNPEAWAQVSAMSPAGRVGEPRDIADVVAFLASDDSRWVTGQWIDATGGALL